MARKVAVRVLGLTAGGLALALGLTPSVPSSPGPSDSQALSDSPVGIAAEELPEILDQRVHPYRDPHEGGRVVAVVDLTLEQLPARAGAAPVSELSEPPRARLRLRPSAIGPLVDPVRDVRGVRGANHQAARELDSITSEDQLLLRWTGADGQPTEIDLETLFGDEPQSRVSRGHLPERRVRTDGSLDFDAHTSALHTTGFELVTPQLGVGAHTLELVVRGDVRLAVELELQLVDGRLSGQITEVRGEAARDDPPLPGTEPEIAP